MNFKEITRHKWFKKIGIPFAGLLSVILLIALVINLYFSPLLSNQLKKTVSKLSNGLYQVDFEKSSLQVLAGRIVIDHLTLKPDYTVFNRLKAAGKAPNNIYTLAVDRIVFKHIHPFKLYFRNEAEVDEITISQPYIQSVYHEVRDHDLPDSNKKTYYQRISGTVKSLHIGQILLDNIKLKYQEEVNRQTRTMNLQEINVKVTDLLIDSNSGNDPSRFNFCKDITVVFNNYAGQTVNKLYRFGARSVTFSSARSSVKVVDAVFMPQKLVSQGMPQGQFSLQTDSVTLHHFDYKSYISYRKLQAADLCFYGGKAEIFYDRSLPKLPSDSTKVGLYALLKNVHRDIDIKTLHLDGIDLSYAEISAKTHLRGVITFEKLSGNVHHIVTGKDTFGTNRKLTANLTANLMGYGKLDVNMHFDPADSLHLLYYKGRLGPMNLVNLNPATKPLGLIQFTNGIVTALTFDMQASTKKATGNVTFLYHDLNVVLLKLDEKNALRRMGFMSILANAFVLIRDNPVFNAPPRSKNIVYERPENVSYLGLLWRSVYSGIKESIGLSAEIEQNLRKRVLDYKQNKEQRILKKAERQEKRKLRRLKRSLKEVQDF